jgi:hypothetical protein
VSTDKHFFQKLKKMSKINLSLQGKKKKERVLVTNDKISSFQAKVRIWENLYPSP